MSAEPASAESVRICGWPRWRAPEVRCQCVGGTAGAACPHRSGRCCKDAATASCAGGRAGPSWVRLQPPTSCE
eukprot:135946-Alexandrium_andersonii.AAC.1